MVDTSRYANYVGEGMLGRLLRDGIPVDSVDLAFGFHVVGRDSVLFLPVESAPFDGIMAETYPTVHVLQAGSVRHRLTELVPHFNPAASSPAVLGSILYYWGLDPQPSGETRLLAMRYDVRGMSLDSTVLDTVRLATDYRWYLRVPRREQGRIVFDLHGERIWRLPLDLSSR